MRRDRRLSIKWNRERHEFIDYDYLDDLTDSEFQWLMQFSDEYYNGNRANYEDPIHSYEKYPNDYSLGGVNESRKEITTVTKEKFDEVNLQPYVRKSNKYRPSDYSMERVEIGDLDDD